MKPKIKKINFCGRVIHYIKISIIMMMFLWIYTIGTINGIAKKNGKKISQFLRRIVRIIGVFILTVFFFTKYFVNLAWEIITMVFHEEEKKSTQSNDNETYFIGEDIPKFSDIRGLLKNSPPKQVGKTILLSAKDMVHQTHKRFWKDMEKILPIILPLPVFVLLGVLMAYFGISLNNVGSIWLIIIGFVLYLVLFYVIRHRFKRFLDKEMIILRPRSSTLTRLLRSIKHRLMKSLKKLK